MSIDGRIEETERIRAKICEFIQTRLQAKLDNLKDDDQDKRDKLLEQYRPEVWLADAASRARQIHLATHIVKPMHPDARGTNVCASFMGGALAGYVGSRSLGTNPSSDVVGNAAALDVFKFLTLDVDGRSLLDRALTNDDCLIDALSADAITARAWCLAFSSIAQNAEKAASHTLARQVYFPLSDGSYHLLGPLFPTSLVHEVQSRMKADRFGEEAKAARGARSAGLGFAHGYCEYPNLAIRKLGGTKPQNISQLNSERYGENWLLASLPPNWESPDIRPLWNAESLFTHVGRQPRTRELLQELLHFLQRTSHNNLAIRRRRAAWVSRVCDEVFDCAALLQELDPGWTRDPRCRLHEGEQLWLDPLRGDEDSEFGQRRCWDDWPGQVSRRFANWLNAELTQGGLSVGDAEHAEWIHVLSEEIEVFRTALEEQRD